MRVREALKILALEMVVFVNRPHDKIAGESAVGGVAVKREIAMLLLGTVGDYVERPEQIAFLVTLGAIVSDIISKWEAITGHIARGGMRGIEKRDNGQVGLGIGGLKAVAAFEVKRKHPKIFVVSANRFDITDGIGFVSEAFVLGARDRPELPTREFIAMAKMEDWVNVIVRNDILFDRVGVNGEGDEMDVIVKEAVLERAVERQDSGVIEVGVGRALLEIEWKNGEALGPVVRLIPAAVEAD